jgi:hypothetical protein
MEKEWFALVGGCIGATLAATVAFGLNYLKASAEKKCKEKNFIKVIHREIEQAVGSVKKKMQWLTRKPDGHPDDDLMVEVGYDKLLYLGEKEEFTISIPFWKGNFNEILSTISHNDFERFWRVVRELEMFEVKFADMKKSFDSPMTTGKHKGMARICFEELQVIYNKKELQDFLPKEVSALHLKTPPFYNIYP